METAAPKNDIACRLVLDGAREHLDFESEVGMLFQPLSSNERSLLDYGRKSRDDNELPLSSLHHIEQNANESSPPKTARTWKETRGMHTKSAW